MAGFELYLDRAIDSLPEHAKQALQEGKRAGKPPVAFVGMSGGVDSSVTAYILKSAGFDVRGYFIKVWQPEDIVCTWKEDRRDAMRVCAELGIPFETVYAEDEYKKHVADYMINEYRAGRTPNPDIMCNKYVKFGVFYAYAMAHGADFIATGHYARTRTIKRSTSVEMLQARDQNKDQTYFLWAIGMDQVAKTLFPVGDLKKDEVRIIAEGTKLHVSAKKDSQGVCFIGKFDMKEFLKQYIKTEKGNVLNSKGEVVGTHDGALLYTIGERHGFTLSIQTPESKRSFVIQKNVDKNELVVGSQEELMQQKSANEATLSQINFISKDRGETKKLKARIRHRQELQAVTIEPLIESENKIGIKVKFKENQQGIAKGQSCVLYDGDICLGGGIIS